MAGISDAFGDMWRDAVKNREKWGCRFRMPVVLYHLLSFTLVLGKTATLRANDREFDNSMCWISYWKSVDHLLAFAHGSAHRKGWDMYLKLIKEHKHLGLMHELYAVPKKHWETMYHNYEPFGFGT
jgi:hypothetical protein